MSTTTKNNSTDKFSLNQNGGWLRADRQFNMPVNLFIDNFSKPHLPGINIALLCEPERIGKSKDFFISNKHQYHVILTYNQDVLNSCENAELFEFGSSWINDLELTKNKKFEVSFLVGGKRGLDGYDLRHRVWAQQDDVKIPKNFFNSSHMPYGTNTNCKILHGSKEPLFTSQYHICIENCKERNWFTEKLVDCLYTKTIPIYWGCPNIEDWFDTGSILIVNDYSELLSCVNNLSEDFYDNHINSINKNFELCKKFVSFHERVCDKIEEIVLRYS